MRTYEDIARHLGISEATVLAVAEAVAECGLTVPLPGQRQMPYGESHWKAKLTETSVREIRWAFNLGESITSIAKRYAVEREAIRRVCERLTWKK